MHYSKRRSGWLLRAGAFTSTTDYDLGDGKLDPFDAILIHYQVSSYSTGNVTIAFQSIPDSEFPSPTRILRAGNSAWTTSAISADGTGTLIIDAPIPRDAAITLTGASTPSMSLAVWIEAVSIGR